MDYVKILPVEMTDYLLSDPSGQISLRIQPFSNALNVYPHFHATPCMDYPRYKKLFWFEKSKDDVVSLVQCSYDGSSLDIKTIYTFGPLGPLEHTSLADTEKTQFDALTQSYRALAYSHYHQCVYVLSVAKNNLIYITPVTLEGVCQKTIRTLSLFDTLDYQHITFHSLNGGRELTVISEIITDEDRVIHRKKDIVIGPL